MKYLKKFEAKDDEENLGDGSPYLDPSYGNFMSYGQDDKDEEIEEVEEVEEVEKGKSLDSDDDDLYNFIIELLKKHSVVATKVIKKEGQITVKFPLNKKCKMADLIRITQVLQKIEKEDALQMSDLELWHEMGKPQLWVDFYTYNYSKFSKNTDLPF
jgi:hypothetical protein